MQQGIGAGSGNRTRALSLEGSYDTISPYPRGAIYTHPGRRMQAHRAANRQFAPPRQANRPRKIRLPIPVLWRWMGR